MVPIVVVEDFRLQHRQIEEQLEGCERVLDQVAVLHAKLLELKPLLLKHLDAKDGFYTELIAICMQTGDVASANVAQLFEGNMKVQSAAVRRFFSALDAPGSPLLSQSFKTMALIIRGRLSQEERAVFPLYLKAAR